VTWLVGARFGRVLSIRAVVAIPAVVVLGQLGPLPLLFSTPILVIATDAIRYVHGRLSDPPAPAGVLPGEHPRHGLAHVARFLNPVYAFGPPARVASSATHSLSRVVEGRSEEGSV
jgi:hypothetical protein